MSTIQRENKYLSISQNDSVGDSIEFSVGFNSGLHVEIDNPWSGDTETGFGRTAYITIPTSDLPALIDFLLNFLNEQAA